MANSIVHDTEERHSQLLKSYQTADLVAAGEDMDFEAAVMVAL